MELYSIFIEILLILVVAAVLAFAFERVRLPPILGYLLAGSLLGPSGLHLLRDLDRIHEMAELGIFFLMLTIGLEFSLDRLRGIRRVAIGGGLLQILFSIAISLVFVRLIGWPLYRGFFLGSVIALSSTAIVLKFLTDSDQLDTQFGRVAVGILIFQDFAVVPLMIMLNSLGGTGENLVPELMTVLLKTFVFVGGVLTFARFVLPRLIRRIAATQSRDILFLFLVIFCLAISCFSYQLGLSFAIGSFFAGLILANTEISSQFRSEVTPFRHLFVSLFFVSIGLLFNMSFLIENAALIFMLVVMVLLVNFCLMTGIVAAFGFAPRTALATGIILSQIGEFSFLLIETARGTEKISPFFYSVLLSTTFVTMFLTPFLFRLLPGLMKMTVNIPLLGIRPFQSEKELVANRIQEHVILCGFGPSGRDLAASLREVDVPFVIVDFNAENYREARRLGYTALYGDASNRSVLEHAGIHRARAVLISFPDPIGMQTIVRLVEEMNPEVLLAVRTRYQREMPKLYELGADIVVMDEWEASIEMHRLLLTRFGVSGERLEKMIQHVRNRKELAVEEAIFKKTFGGA